eukprot:3996969-Prymnesium_polylepis.1
MASLRAGRDAKLRAVVLGTHSVSVWQSGSYGRALAAWAANAEERSRRQVRGPSPLPFASLSPLARLLSPYCLLARRASSPPFARPAVGLPKRPTRRPPHPRAPPSLAGGDPPRRDPALQAIGQRDALRVPPPLGCARARRVLRRLLARSHEAGGAFRELQRQAEGCRLLAMRANRRCTGLIRGFRGWRRASALWAEESRRAWAAAAAQAAQDREALHWLASMT